MRGIYLVGFSGTGGQSLTGADLVVDRFAGLTPEALASLFR